MDNRNIIPPSFSEILSNVSLGAGRPNGTASLKESAEKYISENCPYIMQENGTKKYYITHNINIGRLPHNDVELQDASVSRVHCRIYIEGGRYYIADLSASNPVKVNGMQIGGGKCELRDSDRISLGSSCLIFRFPVKGDIRLDETV